MISYDLIFDFSVWLANRGLTGEPLWAEIQNRHEWFRRFTLLLLLPREEGASFSEETATAAVVKLLLPLSCQSYCGGFFVLFFLQFFSAPGGSGAGRTQTSFPEFWRSKENFVLRPFSDLEDGWVRLWSIALVLRWWSRRCTDIVKWLFYCFYLSVRSTGRRQIVRLQSLHETAEAAETLSQ